MFGLFGKTHERAGFALYTTAVQAAREPWFYQEAGVPDTLDGRFDMVGVYVALVIRRLRSLPPPGAALAQAVFDAMFSDMDAHLRELGVSDMRVARGVKAMWEAFNGRAAAYQAALDAGDPAALAEALARNVWRHGGGLDGSATGAGGLARLVMAQDGRLAEQGLETLRSGHVEFLAPQDAAA